MNSEYTFHRQVRAELQDQFATRIVPRGATRRIFLRREYVKRFGYTDGCLGCTAVEKTETAVAHSEVCKKRLVSEMERAKLGRITDKSKRDKARRAAKLKGALQRT